MKTIPFLPEYFMEISIHIDKGNPIIMPSESSYGFSGSIESQRGIKQVERIKGRQQKPFLVLVKDIIQMNKYADVSIIQHCDLYTTPKSPTSFILPKKGLISSKYFPKFSTIGIRKCLYKPLIGFLSFYKKPIFSTSANISGEEPIYTEEEIKESFSHIPNLLFVSAGDLPKNPASQIIKPQLSNGTLEFIYLRK